MKALGPGVRVFVGWCPDDRTATTNTTSVDPRLKTGTIIDGPNAPQTFHRDDGEWRFSSAWFSVDVDSVGLTYVAEPFLTPIDDDEAEPREVERDVAKTA